MPWYYAEMNTSSSSPLQIVQQLIEALNTGALAAATACYTTDAVFVPEPGTVVTGHAAIQEALANLIALRPVLHSRSQAVFESADVALYCAEWSMTGTAPDGSPVALEGKSSDVICRQPDGSWLIAIDNPFGSAVLTQSTSQAR